MEDFSIIITNNVVDPCFTATKCLRGCQVLYHSPKKKAGLRLLMCYFFLSAWETEAIILWDDVDWSAVAYSDCDTACFNWWSALMAEFSLHHILYEASSNTN